MSDWYIKDLGPKSFEPLTDLKASFEIRTGGLTVLERIILKRGSSPDGFLCEDALRAEMISARTGLQHCKEPLSSNDIEIQKADTPWGLLDKLPNQLQSDLDEAEQFDLLPDVVIIGDCRVDISPTATVHPNVVFDATHGAIRVEANATIRPHAVLIGPCWVGQDSIIYEHSLIKMNTVIGPMCKIGGEVGGTIFQGFSNKCHEGHLGDSIIGEWVNFGSGTTNSNLLNTYSDVILQDLAGKRHKTGRAYVGCFIGDHVKFGICSRIMTGTIVGTGAMIASTNPVPSPTPRFNWVTDNGTKLYRIEKFIEVAKIVMARRNQDLHKSAEQVIRHLAGA